MKEKLKSIPLQQIIVAMLTAALTILGPHLGLEEITTWVIAAISGSYIGAQGLASVGSQQSLNSLDLFKSNKFFVTMLTIVLTPILTKIGLGSQVSVVIGILVSVYNLTKGGQDMVAPLSPKYLTNEVLIAKGFSNQEYDKENEGLGTILPEGAVFYHTGLPLSDSIQQSLDTKYAKYHMIIGPDGTRHCFHPFSTRVEHCGPSSLFGRQNCNDFLIGIAFTGRPGFPLNELELTSAAQVLERTKSTYHKWNDAFITTHRLVEFGATDLTDSQWTQLQHALS